MKKWAVLLLVVVGVASFPQDGRQYLPPEGNIETKESRRPFTSEASPQNDVTSPEKPERFSESYNEFTDPARTKDRYQFEGESGKQINNFAETNEYRPGYNDAFRDKEFSNDRYNYGQENVPSYSYNDRNTNSEAGEQHDLNRNKFQESPSESEGKRPSSEYGGYGAPNEVNKAYDNDYRNTVLPEEPNKRLSQDPSASSQQYPDRDRASYDNRYSDQSPEIIANNEGEYQHSRSEGPHSVPRNSYYSDERPQGDQVYKNDQPLFHGYNADERGHEKGQTDSQRRGYASPTEPINQSEFSETFPNQGNNQNNPNSRTPANQTPSSLYGSPSYQDREDPVVSNRDRPQASDASEVELLEPNQYTSSNSVREKLPSSGDRVQSSNTESLGNDRRNNQEVQYDSRNRDYTSDDSSYSPRDSSGQTDRLGSSNGDSQRISDSRYTDQTSEYRPSELSTSHSSAEDTPETLNGDNIQYNNNRENTIVPSAGSLTQSQQETPNSQNGPSSVSEFVPSNNPPLNEETSQFNGYNSQSDTSDGAQTSANGRQPYQNDIPALNTNVGGLRTQEQDFSVNQNLSEGKPNSQVDEVTNFQDTAEALNADNIQYNNNRENTVVPSAVSLTPQSGGPNALNDVAISQPFDPLYKPAQYEFDYRVQFPPTGTDFGHHERRVDAETQGEYFVLLPDGRTQVVEYEADEDGYKPNIRYEGVISKFRLGLNRLRF